MPGQTLPALSLRTDGQAVTIGRADPGRLQMLLFERGHWCSSCRRRLSLVAEEHDAFSQRGIDIVAVTHEHPGSTGGRIYPFPLVADPDLELANRFDLAGIDEFGALTIRPASVVARDNAVVAYSYIGDDSRDRPTIAALLLALDHLL